MYEVAHPAQFGATTTEKVAKKRMDLLKTLRLKFCPGHREYSTVSELKITVGRRDKPQ